MDAKAETDRLLKLHGAVLKRDYVHQVYHIAGFGVFVRAKTPSSRNESWADLTTLRRVLGLQDGKGQEGERRVKKVKAQAQPTREKLTPINSFADKLRDAGVSTDALEYELRGHEARANHLKELVSDYEFIAELTADSIAALQDEIRSLKARRCECAGCQVTRWGKRLWRRLLLLPD